MKKKGETIVAVLTLSIIALGLILSYSHFSSLSTSLSVNNSQGHNTEQESSFTYQNARNSIYENVVYENNFGGSNNDILHNVYNLDYYYAIGTTYSKDYYFDTNTLTQDLFIMQISKYGNCESISYTHKDYALTFINSYIIDNAIYLLTHSTNLNATVIMTYSFYSYTITEVATINNIYPLDFVIDNNKLFIVGCDNNNILKFTTYNLDNKTLSTLTSNTTVHNIMLTTSFDDGNLVFANTEDSFIIYHVTSTSIFSKYMDNDYTLQNFTINNNDNYFLLLQCDITLKAVTLNKDFDIINTNTLQGIKDKAYIVHINQAYYVVTQSFSGSIVIYIFSISSDLVFELELELTPTKLIEVMVVNDRILLLYSDSDNNLNITTLDHLTNTLSHYILQIKLTHAIVAVIQSYDGNLNFFGNYNNTSAIVTQNYGNIDFYTFKYLWS